MLGITFESALGMGDRLQFASFPENYHRNTGEKVIDVDHTWVFDHNPFVLRGEEPTHVINLWRQPWPELARIAPRDYFAKPVFFSTADRTAGIFNHVAYLRHPRLYAYEDLPRIPNRVVLHTTGSRKARIQPEQGEDEYRTLPEHIIDLIRKTYRNYDVIQVGAKDDVDANVIDCRGLDDIWETVRLIAQASIFIGVDSGPSWISACYPGIFKKKVLVQYPPEFLRKSFVPMHIMNPHHHWHDFSFTYYNRSQDDAGVTFTYLKL
jgi:hypothetical protein